ncbi:hypothetical protein Mgra_00006110 [Meloidogyne graminicola]|uniref:Uncharacterized protein n=1 Tax=Meloidogyne graminicola TaxID=189291 RepID=A0A8S9ZN82_9BILA|nr:hypothetical protein Mgra_00006110 [Meloidogyne graminicola]
MKIKNNNTNTDIIKLKKKNNLEDHQFQLIMLLLQNILNIVQINWQIILEVTALDRSPSSFILSELTTTESNNNLKDHLLPSGLLLFSFCGFLLILLIIIFLLKIFRSSDNELKNSKSSRELQIILLPKNRLNKIKEEEEDENENKENQQINQPITGRKLFTKRIYELQAEEGYYSCPPSMRTSFEAD